MTAECAVSWLPVPTSEEARTQKGEANACPTCMTPQGSKGLYLNAPDGFVDAPDLAWVEAARDILHAHSATDELQHGLPLQEGCCRDVHVEGEA